LKTCVHQVLSLWLLPINFKRKATYCFKLSHLNTSQNIVAGQLTWKITETDQILSTTPKKIDVLNIYNTKRITIIPTGWLYSLFTVLPINRLIKRIKILRLINAHLLVDDQIISNFVSALAQNFSLPTTSKSNIILVSLTFFCNARLTPCYF
jgi:hypothetical protein